MTSSVGGSEGAATAPPTCYRHQDRETWISCQRCARPICPDCMNSASVGFQCPHCVREGAKSTRQARTPYGGKRTEDPRITSFVLIGLNVLVWLAIMATGGAGSTLVDKLALLPGSANRQLSNGTISLVQGVNDGAYWQLVTSMFTHVQPLHLGFNMLALYFLGPTLEGVLGRARFLAAYFVSGLAGSAAVMVLSAPNGQTLGASGAIFGMMGVLVVVALKVRGQVQSVAMWIGLNLIFTFTIPNISWQGHLGGLAGGLIVGAAMVYAPRARRPLVQWGVTSLVLLVSLVAIAVRISTL
ncbi:MAG: rhomboid family intramembrane serine protease [Marmoricola sp.]